MINKRHLRPALFTLGIFAAASQAHAAASLTIYPGRDITCEHGVSYGYKSPTKLYLRLDPERAEAAGLNTTFFVYNTYQNDDLCDHFRYLTDLPADEAVPATAEAYGSQGVIITVEGIKFGGVGTLAR